ncbi:MAG: hypothetical protein LBN93_10280 [Candidatus Symbiothrix sp.]|jgi:uncharacterized protein involved in exopolysaccharide biosynthesis|nr:hypothetical protein [Candidatus Symbiothrix sp.]
METKDFIQLIFKNWRLFALSFFICGVIGVLYYVFATPVFDVTATVSLRHNESLTGGGSASIGSGSSSMLSMLGMRSGSENIEDEALKMGSEGSLKSVVKSLGLHTDYVQSKGFGLNKTPLYDGSPIMLSLNENFTDTLNAHLEFKLDIKKDKATVKLKADKKRIGSYTVSDFPATIETVYGPFTFSRSDYYNPKKLPLTLIISVDNNDAVAQIYQKLVAIDFKKKTSDFILLDMPAKKPTFAKKILNQIIANYNQDWDDEKILSAEKTADFIDQRLRLVGGQLINSDANIQQFKDKNDLTDIESNIRYYFSMSSDLQSGILSTKTQLETADILTDFVKDPKNKYALIPFNLNTDATVSDVITNYNNALMKRNESYKSNIQSSLAQSQDEQIEAQRKNLLLSLENMKKGLGISLHNLSKKEAEFNAKIGHIPTVEKNYIHLKRDQEVQQAIYIFLLEMQEKIGVQGTTLLPKLKVIDAPYTKIKWISPSKKIIAVFIFFFGMALPFAWLYVPKLRRKLRE